MNIPFSHKKMNKIFAGVVFLVSISLYTQQTLANTGTYDGPVVQITDGVIQGVSDGDVDSFKGIPYAAPPVGEYRWRPPKPVVSWEGVRDATEFCATCAQGGWGAAPGTMQEGSSEDCLFLNIWRPAGVMPEAKLPVMVWIHGGGFTGGSGNTSGDQFARNGVILVSINYRLGRLGHFAFPALSQE
jgi:para-nitrobenzyl esterase